MQTLYNTAVFIKLDSAKGCQGFRETKMRNGERVTLAVLNLCVRNEIRANHSVIRKWQMYSQQTTIFISYEWVSHIAVYYMFRPLSAIVRLYYFLL